ncbi:hypothetical protein ACA910_011524 [Epithemia clementina (nom. ined.)]
MDFTPLYGRHENDKLFIQVRTWCPMGQSPSPFVTVQQTRRLKQITMGDPKDPVNVFDWSSIHLNLPRLPTYHPGEPWITKRRHDGCIAADAQDYVDDLCGTALAREMAWQVGSRIVKMASFLGVQDAA